MLGPPSLLFNDFYELTMAQAYHKASIHRRYACFDYFFRRNPFKGGYTIFAGLEDLIRFIESFQFYSDDIDYLKSLGVFTDDFIQHLMKLRFTGDIYAPPEGTPVFPLEPVMRVQGPLEECQLLESVLLNTINFQSLIATKAARVCQEAGEDNVIEFGLRRAQGIDGALSASRAAYIGGCAATSNLLAGKRFAIPVRGTHAHSYVLAFESELAAFRRFAEDYPDNTVLLLDTYNVIESGLPNAIKVGLEMKQRGHLLRGVRIDSGDLAYLSNVARTMLDDAGLVETKIICSGDLDEYVIQSLNAQTTKIDGYGVGTNLISADGESALSGVYKLNALRENGKNGPRWLMRIKLTEELQKMTLPGPKQVFRLHNRQQEFIADIIELEGVTHDFSKGIVGVHPLSDNQRKSYDSISRAETMLLLVVKNGRVQLEFPSLEEVRKYMKREIKKLDPTTRRLMNPHVYKVSLSPELHRVTEQTRRAIDYL
ncbi:MAG: nicotinate phosphoribosyltransferase [Deltaproteobacteria bacterium]|nr:nicotinate phosphoribosyltransferase [Deltaproteobacteria bacterium]